MKVINMKYSAFAMLNNEIKAHRFFCSEDAKDNWCNKQYNRFGEEVTVEVYDMSMNLIETWHA